MAYSRAGPSSFRPRLLDVYWLFSLFGSGSGLFAIVPLFQPERIGLFANGFRAIYFLFYSHFPIDTVSIRRYTYSRLGRYLLLEGRMMEHSQEAFDQ